MGTYNLGVAAQKIYESKLSLFSVKTLKDILPVEKEGTFFSLLKRLVKSGVLQKIEKNKYLLKTAVVDNFVLANFVYQPSYVSFESALSFYGILSQFPYEITSATSKKPKHKIVQGKAFTFIHLKKNLFWGYEKKNDFLIAMPEKALLDQLYLFGKGLRKINLDELDLNFINTKRLTDYFRLYPRTRQFLTVWGLLCKYLKE